MRVKLNQFQHSSYMSKGEKEGQEDLPVTLNKQPTTQVFRPVSSESSIDAELLWNRVGTFCADATKICDFH